MISTEAQLRALYAAPAERALRKQLDRLDAHCRRFIALSPLCVLATGGGAGSLLDASPRGGPPGFVQVGEDGDLLLAATTGWIRSPTCCTIRASACCSSSPAWTRPCA